MRVVVLIAAVLALGSPAVHLLVPFATVEVAGEDGALTQHTLSRHQMDDRLDGNRAAVPGASMGYLLAGVAILALGGVGLLISLAPGPVGRWALLGGGALAGLGGAMSLHGNALWLGRGISSAIHGGITGASTPAAAHAHLGATTPGDAFASIIPITPIVLVGLAMAVLALVAWAWPASLGDQRGIRDMARRHGRLALLGGGILVLTMATPWVAQDLPEATAEGSPTHVYLWSAYDVLQKEAAGAVLTQGGSEVGVIPWSGLAIVIAVAAWAGLAAVVAPWLGLAGRHLENEGQGVFGRLLENASLAAVAAYAYLLVAGFLGAFVLHEPTRFDAALTTGLPLVVAALGLTGLIAAGMMARRVMAVEGNVVADDFPEPVVFD